MYEPAGGSILVIVKHKLKYIFFTFYYVLVYECMCVYTGSPRALRAFYFFLLSNDEWLVDDIHTTGKCSLHCAMHCTVVESKWHLYKHYFLLLGPNKSAKESFKTAFGN